jgi:hypothetical protein
MNSIVKQLKATHNTTERVKRDWGINKVERSKKKDNVAERLDLSYFAKVVLHV